MSVLIQDKNGQMKANGNVGSENTKFSAKRTFGVIWTKRLVRAAIGLGTCYTAFAVSAVIK